MNDELNPSSASERSGHDDSAANAAGVDGNRQPAQKVRPRNRQSRKWFGFTEVKWREIAGFAVLIPWISYDLWDTRNLLKLVILAVSLAIATAVICSFFHSRTKGLIVWCLFLFIIAMIVWANSRPLGLEPPVLSADKIPLSDGRNFPDNEISIFNPNGVTIYWTTLEIVPDVSISPTSLDIGVDQPPESERSLQRGPIVDSFRINRYPSIKQPKCKGVELQLRAVPPLSYRYLRIDGTIATNTWATVSVFGYTNRLNIISPNSPNSPNFGMTPQIQAQFIGMISNIAGSFHSNGVFNCGMDFIAQ